MSSMGTFRRVYPEYNPRTYQQGIEVQVTSFGESTEKDLYKALTDTTSCIVFDKEALVEIMASTGGYLSRLPRFIQGGVFFTVNLEGEIIDSTPDQSGLCLSNLIPHRGVTRYVDVSSMCRVHWFIPDTVRAVEAVDRIMSLRVGSSPSAFRTFQMAI